MANPQFESIRRKLQGGAGVARQENEDQLKRAFARQGGVGSGEFVKQLQMSRDSDQARRDEALQQVDLAEQAQTNEQQRQDELLNRQYSEAEKGRQFESTEAEKARAAQESQFGRTFGLSEKQMQNQQDQFNKTYGLQEKSTLSQIEQADRQFQQDQRDQFFNRLKTSLETKDRFTRDSLLAFENTVFGSNVKDITQRGSVGGDAVFGGAIPKQPANNFNLAQYMKKR